MAKFQESSERIESEAGHQEAPVVILVEVDGVRTDGSTDRQLDIMINDPGSCVTNGPYCLT